ncbi:MAG: hypothetical protein HYX56_03800 [Chloroflexi bacterium]|nr:hypothetical protein [Chloroflexota bacterium]
MIDAAHPDRAALLGHPDGDDPLALRRRRGVQVRSDGGELVLARAERDERDAALLGVAAHRGAEGLPDRREERRRGDRVAAVIAQKGDHAAAALEQRDVRVEDHPVEILDVEGHVPFERLRHGRPPLPLRHRRHLP